LGRPAAHWNEGSARLPASFRADAASYRRSFPGFDGGSGEMKLKLTTLALFAAGLLAGLTLIAPATGADPPATTTSTATVYGSASGAIAALSATAITVNDLTCTRTSSSPSLDGYKVGD